MAEIEKNVSTAAAESEVIDSAIGAEIMEKYEKESRTRNFTNKTMSKVVYTLCLFFTVYHLAYASGIRLLQMVNIKHHAIHVGLVMVLGFALYPAFKKSSRKTIAWYDWICIVLSAVMPVYVFYRYLDWTSTGLKPTT
ncbi:MAG: C4-dicarboxylate ABC transporter permease, partial [Oscillospiraceae bacterium]|nr:C4-dicarboxylate ABC transporter permease [Oscillospiraceae bacterium]